MSAARPAVCAYVLALCVGAAVAHSVYQIPIQPTDTLEVFHSSATASSTWALFDTSLRVSSATLRPVRFLQTRWLLQIAEITGATYHAVFRGIHAALAIALILLFVHALRIRTWPDLAALGIALLVLLGLHTFTPIMREAFPVNHFLEIAVATLAVFALAQAPPKRMTTVAIALLLVFGLPLIESGVLIWVAVAACAAAGMRGIDRRTIIVATVLLAGYVLARRALDIEMPGIGGHGSGFGGQTYSSEELVARFGAQPAVFAVYNIVASLLSVLFSEPRYGVYAMLAAEPEWRVGFIVNLASSLLITVAIIWYLARRLPRARAAWTDGDRAMVVALLMIAASTPLTMSYIKDDVLSTAGVFYAMAGYVAVRAAIERAMRARLLPAAAMAMVLLTAGSLWAYRVVGLHYQLRLTAFRTRNDWATLTSSNEAAGNANDAGHALQNRLRSEALQRRTIARKFLPRDGGRYWVE